MRISLRIQIFIESSLFIRLIIKIYYQVAKLYILIRVEYLLKDLISKIILTLILNQLPCEELILYYIRRETFLMFTFLLRHCERYRKNLRRILI